MVRSTRWFIDSVIALLLVIGAISLMGTLFFNRRLVFLVGGQIFEMSYTKSTHDFEFPNAPVEFRQGFIVPLLQFFYRQQARRL